MFRILIGIAVLAIAGLAAGGAGDVSAGGGCHSDKLTDGRGVAVDLTGNCFEPTVVRIGAGQTITWTNQDPELHTVTGVAMSFGDYEELGQGDFVSHTFDDSGVFPYFCVLHPSMAGAVVVGDGEASGEEAAAASTDPGGDDSGLSAATVAAIAGAVGLGGAALGLVGSRMISARRAGGAAA